ncbi:hypothetical protein NFI96_003397 [Prochilodus magdalenae]|nr:hypothetical protein NFI96_003397 [Prochilodus magdalenae]
MSIMTLPERAPSHVRLVWPRSTMTRKRNQLNRRHGLLKQAGGHEKLKYLRGGPGWKAVHTHAPALLKERRCPACSLLFVVFLRRGAATSRYLLIIATSWLGGAGYRAGQATRRFAACSDVPNVLNGSQSATEIREEPTPWRKVSWSEKGKILDELNNFKPALEVLRIVLYGPIGAGKSSVINSVQRALLGRNFIGAQECSTLTGKSFTQSCNPIESIRNEHPKYNRSPSPRDKAHCLVSVLPADCVSMMEGRIFDKCTKVRDKAKELEEPTPWRKVPWSEKGKILDELMALRSTEEVLRIVLYGPIGAGKSSFINSVQRALLGRNFIGAQECSTCTGRSCTLSVKTYRLKKPGGDQYPLEFVDTMGFEAEEDKGMLLEDLIKILEGYILDGYTCNPIESICNEHPKYNRSPSLHDKAHCLVSVLPADCVSMMESRIFENCKMVQDKAKELGIPHVIILTKVDKACEEVSKDVTNIYTSKKIEEKVDLCSNYTGISINSIYPVKNYHTEITQNDDADVLILMALRDIFNFANDYVEDLKRTHQKK